VTKLFKIISRTRRRSCAATLLVAKTALPDSRRGGKVDPPRQQPYHGMNSLAQKVSASRITTNIIKTQTKRTWYSPKLETNKGTSSFHEYGKQIPNNIHSEKCLLSHLFTKKPQGAKNQNRDQVWHYSEKSYADIWSKNHDAPENLRHMTQKATEWTSHRNK